MFILLDTLITKTVAIITPPTVGKQASFHIKYHYIGPTSLLANDWTVQAKLFFNVNLFLLCMCEYIERYINVMCCKC